MTKTLVLISALAGLLAAPQAAAAPTCGATVYADISLTANLVCPAGSDGIVIGADNLRVDLNGYTITTQHVWSTAGVRSAGFKGIKVFGPGRIENFTTGVALSGGEWHEVRELEVTGSTGTSIVLHDASFSTVAGNRATGLYVRSNATGRADGNTFSGNVAWIVWVGGCNTTNTQVVGNDLTANVIFQAVGLLPGSTGTRVYGNRITDGSVYVGGSSGNLIEGNTIALRQGGGTGYSGVVFGEALSSCPGGGYLPAAYNKVRSNGIEGGIYSVRLYAGSFKNEVNNNKLYGAAQAALSFTAGADDNDARDNAIYGTPAIAIDSGRGNLWP